MPQSPHSLLSWATLGQWLSLSEPELSLCNNTHISAYFTELLKEFPETMYEEWLTQRSKCPINICGENSQEQRHFFFIHYKVLTQMHPSLVFDSVSTFLSKLLLHLSSNLYSTVHQEWSHQTLVIPQSLKNLFISAHFSKDNGKNLWLVGLACDLSCYFISYRGSHPSFCLTHIDLSALHSCPTPTIGPLHVLFSLTGTFFPPPPEPVNIFSSFIVIHPILLSNSSPGLPDHIKSPLSRYPLLWGTYCILLWHDFVSTSSI